MAVMCCSEIDEARDWVWVSLSLSALSTGGWVVLQLST